MRSVSAPLLIGVVLLSLAGCASPGVGKSGQDYVVNTQRTAFYIYGPAQATGQDFSLYKGDRVTLLNDDSGYSHVKVASTGQNGYVATEDLITAPPLPKPSPTPTARHRRQAAFWMPQPTPPLVPQVYPNQPLPDIPEGKPPPGSPGFRY